MAAIIRTPRARAVPESVGQPSWAMVSITGWSGASLIPASSRKNRTTRPPLKARPVQREALPEDGGDRVAVPTWFIIDLRLNVVDEAGPRPRVRIRRPPV